MEEEEEREGRKGRNDQELYQEAPNDIGLVCEEPSYRGCYHVL
jgi:hypothetical protein